MSMSHLEPVLEVIDSHHIFNELLESNHARLGGFIKHNQYALENIFYSRTLGLVVSSRSFDDDHNDKSLMISYITTIQNEKFAREQFHKEFKITSTVLIISFATGAYAIVDLRQRYIEHQNSYACFNKQKQISKLNLKVPSLLYIEEINTTAIDYCIGHIQLWDCKLRCTIYLLKKPTCLMPVIYINFIEPSDDLNNLCYLWTIQSDNLRLPIATMIALTYKERVKMLNRCMTYRVYQENSIMLEIPLKNVTGIGQCVSALSIFDVDSFKDKTEYDCLEDTEIICFKHVCIRQEILDNLLLKNWRLLINPVLVFNQYLQANLRPFFGNKPNVYVNYSLTESSKIQKRVSPNRGDELSESRTIIQCDLPGDDIKIEQFDTEESIDKVLYINQENKSIDINDLVKHIIPIQLLNHKFKMQLLNYVFIIDEQEKYKHGSMDTSKENLYSEEIKSKIDLNYLQQNFGQTSTIQSTFMEISYLNKLQRNNFEESTSNANLKFVKCDQTHDRYVVNQCLEIIPHTNNNSVNLEKSPMKSNIHQQSIKAESKQPLKNKVELKNPCPVSDKFGSKQLFVHEKRQSLMKTKKNIHGIQEIPKLGLHSDHIGQKTKRNIKKSFNNKSVNYKPSLPKSYIKESIERNIIHQEKTVCKAKSNLFPETKTVATISKYNCDTSVKELEKSYSNDFPSSRMAKHNSGHVLEKLSKSQANVTSIKRRRGCHFKYLNPVNKLRTSNSTVFGLDQIPEGATSSTKKNVKTGHVAQINKPKFKYSSKKSNKFEHSCLALNFQKLIKGKNSRKSKSVQHKPILTLSKVKSKSKLSRSVNLFISHKSPTEKDNCLEAFKISLVSPVKIKKPSPAKSVENRKKLKNTKPNEENVIKSKTYSDVSNEHLIDLNTSYSYEKFSPIDGDTSLHMFIPISKCTKLCRRVLQFDSDNTSDESTDL